MGRYKIIAMGIILIIAGCGEKKPDHYGMFIYTDKETIEAPIIEPVPIRDTSEYILQQFHKAVEKTIINKIKKISIRHPRANDIKIYWMSSPFQTSPSEIWTFKEKKDIDWVIYKFRKEEIKEGLYFLTLGEITFPEKYYPIATFFYGSPQKFVEELKELESVESGRERSTTLNMHTIQIAVERYATERNGKYPTTLAALLPYLPQNFKNPFDSTIPAVIISFTDPPDWSIVRPGQVVYVPLQIEEGGARTYKIYGKGRRRALDLILKPQNY
jgi:hypothetical protein